MIPLLELESLSLSLGSKILLNRLTFSLFPRQRCAIVGASGSGKSLTLATIGRLLPRDFPWKPEGSIRWNGEELLNMPKERFRKIRQGGIATVLQESMSCLNPSMKIGKQIAEVAQKICPTEWLEAVGLPRNLQYCFPHELSGGMKQRVVLAIALASKPRLLLADEITSALDTHSQEQIIDLIDRVCSDHNIALLLVTHDFSVARALCADTLVMYQGAIVEQAATSKILDLPQHFHSRQLVEAIFL